MKDDFALIKEIKKGSTSAMEDLINRYYKEIFHYTFRVLGSYEDARDVTQDVFIAMMKALPDYREQGRFKSWLFTIAHNKCMNSFKRYGKEVLEGDCNQENLIEQDFTTKIVEKNVAKELLNRLPEMQKSTLILRYYHELTAKEIAQVTDVTTSTVKSRLYQGLQKLQKYIKERD
ncbi:RNA polymerase sigma factor [Bacillus sp. JJ722]|uniref:RNA polymerase sigma factor n=1 Tax=Bacillus sp. JJ722 TaxID=3122973 RepID=UPI002FFF0D34